MEDIEVYKCTICKTELSEEKYVVNWGWCDSCWRDQIDTDHIMNEFADRKVIPPGPPSERVQRIINIIRARRGMPLHKTEF